MKQLTARTQSPLIAMRRASTRAISQGTYGMITSCGRPVQASAKPMLGVVAKHLAEILRQDIDRAVEREADDDVRQRVETEITAS
jgi:hypothetical protein